MSAIARDVRHCVPMFLETIADVKLGQTEGAHIVQNRRGMANTVLAFVAYGDQNNLDLGDIAIAELAAAALKLCDEPQNYSVIDGFVSATTRFNEIYRSLSG